MTDKEYKDILGAHMNEWCHSDEETPTFEDYLVSAMREAVQVSNIEFGKYLTKEPENIVRLCYEQFKQLK